MSSSLGLLSPNGIASASQHAFGGTASCAEARPLATEEGEEARQEHSCPHEAASVKNEQPTAQDSPGEVD